MTKKEMGLEAVHPGVTVEDAINSTGFKLKISKRVAVTQPPTNEELEIARSLDPERRHL
jgi:glutaconate CoA-transferase subunit B